MTNLPNYKIIVIRKRLETWTSRILILVVLCLIPILSFAATFRHNFTLLLACIMTVILFLSGSIAVGASLSKHFLERKTPPIWNYLHDTSHLGDLIDLLDFTQSSTHTSLQEFLQLRPLSFQIAARFQLVRLLPTVQTSDTRYLNASHRRRLNEALHDDDAELILAVLIALEALGDRTAIPSLYRLTAGNGSLKDNKAIRMRAQQCLVTLQQRLAQESTCETLLRPSASTTPPATLLRPSSGTVLVAPEEEAQLLRPTQVQ